MSRISNFVLAMALMIVLGCGQAKPPAVPAPIATDPSPEIKPNSPVDGVSKTSQPTSPVALVATATEGTAEATFQQTLIAFQDGRLDAAFDFLPESYQADVENLVQTFADKMDADLWSQSFHLLNQVSKLLTTKKELILGLDGIKRIPQMESIKPHWETIASGLNEIATSDVSDLGKLKQAGVKRLLVSGSRLITGLPLPKFGDVRVTTVESDADTATLSYTESKDTAPKEVEFVKIEGKWLPKSIATGWSAGISDAKARLAELPDQVAIWKPEVMKQFESVGGMLDQLQAAKTSEEFNAAVAPLMFTIAFSAQMAQQAMKDADNQSRKGTAVNCLINRELNESELTELKDTVLKSLGDSRAQSDYELIPNDGKTRCRFTPVTHPDALVQVLKQHFSGGTVRWDADAKTIYVEFK